MDEILFKWEFRGMTQQVKKMVRPFALHNRSSCTHPGKSTEQQRQRVPPWRVINKMSFHDGSRDKGWLPGPHHQGQSLVGKEKQPPEPRPRKYRCPRTGSAPLAALARPVCVSVSSPAKWGNDNLPGRAVRG